MGAGPRLLAANVAAAGRRIPAAVHAADRRVREMVAAAEEEARAIRQGAEAERRRVLAEAAERGRTEGMARVGALLADAAAERDRAIAAAEPEIVALAIEIARKVLARELSEGGARAAVDLAARAVAGARRRRLVALRVSPADADAVRQCGARLAALVEEGTLSIREDPALAPGDVVVETEAGRIDARVETQLALLAAAIEEAAA